MDRQISAAASQPEPGAHSGGASEHRFQALVEGLDAVVWERDAAGRFTYVSPQAERLLGYPVERWYASATFWSEQLVHPEDRERAVALLVSAGAEGRDQELDYRVVAADGRVVCLRDMVRAIGDAGGRPWLLRGVMVDVTEAKRVEAVLQQQARHAALSADVGAALADGGTLREILQGCAQAMESHLDAAFARIWTLRRAEQLLELQASAGLHTDMDGPHRRIPIGSSEVGRVAAERAPHLTNDVQNDPHASEQEWARREGIVSFAGYPLLVDGRLMGVAALFARHPLSDATLDALRVVADRVAAVVEREETETTLLDRELQLAEAQRIAHLGSWEWHVGSDEVHWSDELFRIYGLPPQSEQCTFDSYLARVHPDDRDRVRETIGRVCALGGVFELEERIVRPDGSVRALLSRGRAITDRQGQVRKLVGTCQDVTEQRAAAARAMELAGEQAARLRAEEEEQRAAFLAEAGQVLSSSLDYATTLRSFAHLAVPRIADWCAVDVVGEDGRVRRVVAAHSDPAKEQAARDLEERYPSDPNATTGVPQVLRTGVPELVREIPPGFLEATVADPEQLRMLLDLQLRSYMVVPLKARGRTLGAITFVAAESGRLFEEDDLRFAQELASRAALAVDNARLFHDAEEASGRVTQILESITDAFFALDHDWRFTYLNREAEALLHRSQQELLGRSLWSEFPDAVGSNFERMYRLASDERRTVHFEEYFLPLSSWFEVRAYPSEEGLSVYFRNITERRQAEEALQYQSYLTRTISENATSALFLMDDRGHCTYLNPAAEAMIGFTLDEIRDMPLHDAIHHHHPDGRPYPMHECPVDRALPENFDIRAHEDVFIRKDGSFFPVVCAASPIFKEGVPVATVVEVRDVTQEKEARRSLQQSEQQYRFLADAIPVQVWTATPEGALDYVSQQTADYFRRTPEEIVGQGWLNVIHPDQVDQVVQRWTHALRTGEPYEVEFLLRGGDGLYRWFLGRAVPQRDADGRIIRWFGSNTDIADRKAIDQEREQLIRELEVERSRLREVFRRAPAFISTLRGPEHVFESANPPYVQLIGSREVLGRPVAEALPEVVEQGFVALLDQVYRTGEPFVGNEVPVLLAETPGGPLKELFVNFVYQPLRDAAGSVSGIFVHGVDITDQVRTRQQVEQKAEELARLARRLEATNRELDQFAYVASHDLKAPLRGIANLSQWIEEDLDGQINAEVREHLELLRGRVHRMEGLIDGILHYSRAGRVREKPETVDTGALLDEVIDLLAPPEHVEVRVGAGMPRLLTERLPLQQVFMNLIGNAVKYNGGRPDGRIEVASESEGDLLRFTVSDNGPGIAPEYHERIFGIFQTLEARDKVEGTGIGLSLVKKIVEARGGRVWLDSAEGEGAAFHFLWPNEASES